MNLTSPLTVIDALIPSDGYVAVKLSDGNVMVFNDIGIRRGQLIERCVGIEPRRWVRVNGIWFSEGRALTCTDLWRERLLYELTMMALAITGCSFVWGLAAYGYYFYQGHDQVEMLKLMRPTLEVMFTSLAAIVLFGVTGQLYENHLQTKQTRNLKRIGE